jgi:predicted P-loop ATPase
MSSIPIRYSRGQSKWDNTPDQLNAADFDTFETEVLSERSMAKGLDYLCGPLSYGDHDDPEKHPGQDHFRLASHAEPKAFLCLDHDGYNSRDTFRQLMADLERFRGFGYTTFSSTDENPRCRIILQLNREVSRAEGISLGASVDQMLERAYGVGAISSDTSVHRSEQPCYLPGEDAEIFHFPGEPLDVDSILRKYRPPLPPASTAPIASDTSSSESYARLTRQSLEMVLSRIDPSHEPTWFEVGLSIARVYGQQGWEMYNSFSKGNYWSCPYQLFDEARTVSKFKSALEQSARRPRGFGMRHLINLAKLKPSELEFEDKPARTTVNTLGSSINQSELLMPCLNAKNAPLAVVENLRAVLAHAGVIARYNQIKKRQEIIVPGLVCVSDETLNTAYTRITDLAVKAGLPATRVCELVDAIAAENPFCPVQTYVKSVPWDGVSRFGQFLAQMATDTPKMATMLWRKWLIQAIAASFEPDGIANAGVMILSGDQGLGKTRLLRDMTGGVPGCFIEGVTLNPADKDSVLNVASHWIVELGELEATFRKADLAQLKAYVTRTVDVVRRPYARKESNLPRRTVFAGTVNDLYCLHDSTGNRRFWPLRVNSITRDTHLDYQQLWAEVYSWYSAGVTWHLSSSEQITLETHCEAFMVNDPEVEALLEHYPFQGCTSWDKKTMTEICRAISIEKPTKAQQMRLAEAIRRLNGGQAPQKSNGQNRHVVPAGDVIFARKPLFSGGEKKPINLSTPISEILNKWDE